MQPPLHSPTVCSFPTASISHDTWAVLLSTWGHVPRLPCHAQPHVRVREVSVAPFPPSCPPSCSRCSGSGQCGPPLPCPRASAWGLEFGHGHLFPLGQDDVACCLPRGLLWSLQTECAGASRRGRAAGPVIPSRLDPGQCALAQGWQGNRARPKARGARKGRVQGRGSRGVSGKSRACVDRKWWWLGVLEKSR